MKLFPLLLLLPAAVSAQEFCITGFVMDKFCINRGTLLDASHLTTLDNPDKHTLHCLLDISNCRNSGFEILTEPKNAQGEYTRALELDETGNEKIIELGRSIGDCSTCDNAWGQEAGMRATVKGTFDPNPPNGIPRLMVSEVFTDDVECPESDATIPPAGPVGGVEPTPAPTPVSIDGDNSGGGNVDCSEFQTSLAIPESPFTMNFVVNLDEDDDTNGYLRAEMVCECQGWIALGIADADVGAMVPADAIIGLPDSNEVRKYGMTGRSPAGVNPLDNQSLEDVIITQNATHTVMSFSKRLVEANEMPIDANGSNNFLWAHGFDGTLGFHAARGIFGLTLNPCINGQGVDGSTGGIEVVEAPGTFRELWSAHGLLAFVAWGIFAPIAIGMSMCRHLIPGEGRWFKIHMFLNMSVLVFTIIAFILAVTAIQKGTVQGADPQHFTQVTHRTVGLAIMILVLIQVIGGMFRPHAPHKNADGTVEEKKSIRTMWEVIHKGSGYILLILCWWEVQEGIRLYSERFGTSDSRLIFFIVVGVIAVVAIGGFIYQLMNGSGDETPKGVALKDDDEK